MYHSYPLCSPLNNPPTHFTNPPPLPLLSFPTPFFFIHFFFFFSYYFLRPTFKAKVKMTYSFLGKSPTLISHNVNSLNIPEKRTKLLRQLKVNLSIVYLQETHFKHQNIPKLTNNLFTKAYHATNPLAKTKGVTILINKNSSLNTNIHSDPEGRYIFLKGNWEGSPITLANVYFPNKAHITFCTKIINKLKWFAEGCIILGGDFNIPLSPLQDTSTGYSHVSYKILKRIKVLLQLLALIDSWRSIHPTGKDYTFFSSPPHKRYSRIDLIFVSQRDLINLVKADIVYKPNSPKENYR